MQYFNKLFSKPAFYVHIFNTIFLLYILFIFYQNYNRLSPNIDKLIIIYSLFSILFALHGISHIYLDKYYNYDLLNLI